MWHFPKFGATHSTDIPKTVAAALIVSVIALAAALAVARWSWLMLDEQVALRKEFVELRNEQTQSNLQYEHWLEKVQQEREALKK